MRIGLTYDLRQEYLDMGYGLEETAEFDKPETIEGIEGALRELGHETVRIGHARQLAARLLEGERWDLVFNIAEGLYGMGREALVPCLLEAYRVPYTFSDPLVMAMCLHKGVCKRVVRDLGIPTAPFHVVETPEEIADVRLDYPLFVKPVAEGTGKGITDSSVIRDGDELEARCRELLATFSQPVLVEAYLPGREFTVGVVGTGRRAATVGAMEVLAAAGPDVPVYSYDLKENYLEKVRYGLVGQGELRSALDKVALDAWRGLGCRDGGRVDLRMDGEGRPVFLEVNPLAGLNPIHSDLPIICRLLGKPYRDLIGEIVASATDGR
jgi:D-alanine-D-alanine ligase